MKKTLLLFFVSLVGWCSAQSLQTAITIHGDDGTASSFTLGETGAIYFSGDMITVKDDASTSVTFDMDHILKVTFSAVEGLEDVENQMVIAYPNPANHSFRLRGIGDEPQMVTIYTLDGRCLFMDTCTEDSQISVSSWPKGFYIVKCGDCVTKICKN